MLVQMTAEFGLRNGEGKSWSQAMKGIPQNAHVSRLVASKYDAATVYLTLSNRREDDNKPYIFRSTDYGENWQSISGNLPAAPVNVVREDPKNQMVLYCGTDLGVYVSKDGGKTWNPCRPTCLQPFPFRTCLFIPATITW